MEDEIRKFIEELDPEGKIHPDKIEDFIDSIKEMEKHQIQDGEKKGDYTFNTIKDQINSEPDWRKRASLAAKIVSLGLE